MKKRNCFNCGYFRKEKNGKNYCNDLDCIVEPFEPACNEQF